MLCSSCQKEIAGGSKFCYNCGAQQPASTSAAPPAYIAPKRLTRSSTDRKIAGVCAGVAEYFDLDPTVVRVVWLLTVLFAGTGVLLYIILWIVLPCASATVTVAVPGPATRV